jgi:thymidine phosphorylase
MKPINIRVASDVPAEDLASHIADSLTQDELMDFIRALDGRVAEWTFSRRIWEFGEELRAAKAKEDQLDEEAGIVANAGWGEQVPADALAAAGLENERGMER